MCRRDFIKQASSALLILSSGKILSVFNPYEEMQNKKPVLRFVVASDGHYGQKDSRGWYAADAPHVLAYEGDILHTRLFGYVKTDKNGKFELHTVKPSGYPRSELPAHIHVHVMAEGYATYGTEFLFDDDDRLVGNIRAQAVRSRFPIAKPEKTIAPFEQQFSYILSLQKQ